MKNNLHRATPACLRRIERRGHPMRRLVCFPNAGAGASIFRKTGARLPSSIEAFSVQLPGREDRFHEACFPSIEHAAERLAAEIAHLCDLPVVFFGHSLGAILAFETASALRTRHGRLPDALILSGHGAPHMRPVSRRCRHDASDQALISDLKRLGGTPPAILDDPHMMSAILPAVRGDYAMLDSYVWRRRAPLACPIASCAGESDSEVSRAAITAWQTHTTGEFCERWFSGDHFYLFDQDKAFLPWLIQTVLSAAASVEENCR